MIHTRAKMIGRSFRLMLLSVVLTGMAGAQWLEVETGAIPTCIAGDGTYVYAGFHGGYFDPGDTTSPRNIIRSSDDGVTWVNASNGLTSGSLYAPRIGTICVAGSNLFAATSGGLFISSDHGDHWAQTSFPSLGQVSAILPEDSLIFAGVDAGQANPELGGIFVSSDNGQSWVRSDSGLVPYSFDYRVTAFGRIGSTLFAGSYLGGIFSSVDNGRSWRSCGQQGSILSIAVIDSILFVGFDDIYPRRSTDMGATWTVCDSGLPADHGVPFLRASGKNLIAGTNFDGVYYSSDMGGYWKPVNEGLGTSDSGAWPISYAIFSLAVINDYVFAGGGITLWRRPLSEITSVKGATPALPKGFELGQNYPNPFNPSTVIRYHLSSPGNVSLKVYDLLGREIGTLVHAHHYGGTHVVTFDASSLASGVYFYSLEVNGSRATKKMLLMK